MTTKPIRTKKNSTSKTTRTRKTVATPAPSTAKTDTAPAKDSVPQPEQDFSKDVSGVKRGLQKLVSAGVRTATGWPQDNVLSRAAAERYSSARIKYDWTGDEASSQGSRNVLSSRVDVLLQLTKKAKTQKSEATYAYRILVKGLYPGRYQHTIQAQSLYDARTQAEHWVDAIVFRLADNMYAEFAKTSGHTLSELLYSAAVALHKTGAVKERSKF